MKKRVWSLILVAVLLMQMCGMETFAENTNQVFDYGTCGAQGNNLTWEISYDGVLTILGTGEMADYEEDVQYGYSSAPWGKYLADIRELVIEDGVTSIGSWAFYGAWNLEKATIGCDIQKISEYAFACVGQERDCMISFYGNAPEMVQTYEPEYTFNGSNLHFFYYADVDTLGWSEIVSREEFRDNFSWHKIGCDGILVSGSCGDYLTWSLKEDGELNVSGNGAMKDNPEWIVYRSLINRVSLPEGLTSLGKGAFVSCMYLKELVIPESVTEIGEYAVADCIGLEKIQFLGNAPSIAENSFEYVEAIVYYPAENFTWSSEIQKNYGGTLTWEEKLMDEQAPVISDIWPATEDAVTLCHDAELQIEASDDIGLSCVEVWCRVGESEPICLGTQTEHDGGVFTINCSLETLSGDVQFIYRAYDNAGNCAEETANVTIRPYCTPVMPKQLTAETGFRSGTLTWVYDGDMETLKHFKVYALHNSGETILLANVKNETYTVDELTEGTWFEVCAEDIYGKVSEPSKVLITPVITEDVAPEAVIQNAELTAVTGKAMNFSGAASTDNDSIASYEWDFGDGTFGTGVNSEHTYTEGGIYTVTLRVTDCSGNQGIATTKVTVYDTLGEDATHAMLTVAVKDGYQEGTPAIGGATVNVYNDLGFSIAAKTNESGVAELVVPKGNHKMSIVKSGYGAKVVSLSVPNEDNSYTFYLAKSGISVIGGELTATSMTYEEIVEAGIDVSNPANNHVVKQEFSIRFQPTPELQFDLDLERLLNATGEMLKDTGFGWHSFVPESGNPDDNDNPDGIITSAPDEWTVPEYDVGVFPVGDSAFMVIYGQSHWLKEMFNVELIVFNTSYAEDITDCYAELPLPEGMSLANLLEGEQHEKVKVGNGTIEYIGKREDGINVGSNIRQVNWYVCGDSEGDYSLTAKVNGKVGTTPFETTFTTEQPIHIYAGNALKLTVTLPKSAYNGKDYEVDFGLTNVSDHPIYNLSFGLQSVYQFVAEYLSDGTQGETEKILDNEDFENKKTYGLPELKPDQTFHVAFKTTFLYEHQFVEWAVGKLPGVETGYKADDTFVVTLNGSTTEIPVEFVYADVEKDSFFEWIWDESIGALKENVKEFVVEFIDDKICQGIPVAENVVKVFEIGRKIKENDNGTEVNYDTVVTLTEGCKFVDEEELMTTFYGAATYRVRRSMLPGVLVWTDAKDYEISEDGMTMKLKESGKLYVMRVGETSSDVGIDVSTCYMDGNDEVKTFTRTLLAKELNEDDDLVGGEYVAGLQSGKYIVMEDLEETCFSIPNEGEDITIHIPAYSVTTNGDILAKASNENWSITDSEGNRPEGMILSGGMLIIGDVAKAGRYTIKLALEGTDSFKTQTIILTDSSSGDGQTSTQNPTRDPIQNESESGGGTEEEREIYWVDSVNSKTDNANSNDLVPFTAEGDKVLGATKTEKFKENDNLLDTPVNVEDVSEDTKIPDKALDDTEDSDTEVLGKLVKENHNNLWIWAIAIIAVTGISVLFALLKCKKEKGEA